MCSIIIIRKKGSFLLATNRDELLDRPSEGPKIRKGKRLKNFSPKDSLKGGTWLGINEVGLFVGITNRFIPQINKSLKSRGELPQLALDAQTPSEALSLFQALNPSEYNPFHLVFANKQEAFVLWSDGHQFHQEDLEEGHHIITESSFGAAENKRASHFEKRLREILIKDNVPLKEFKDLMGEKVEPSFYGPCISIPEKNYGTKSSFVFKITSFEKNNEFYYNDNPPDRGEWVNFKEILQNENFIF